jgi:hypothetical protein
VKEIFGGLELPSADIALSSFCRALSPYLYTRQKRLKKPITSSHQSFSMLVRWAFTFVGQQGAMSSAGRSWAGLAEPPPRQPVRRPPRPAGLPPAAARASVVLDGASGDSVEQARGGEGGYVDIAPTVGNSADTGTAAAGKTIEVSPECCSKPLAPLDRSSHAQRLRSCEPSNHPHNRTVWP